MLAVSGHSFGGITAIGAAIKDQRVKVSLPMDPWFYPYKDEEDTVCLENTPIFSIKSETWYDWVQAAQNSEFDCKKLTDAFFENSRSQGNTTL